MNIITREDLKWILICEIYGASYPLKSNELKAINKLLDDFYDTTKEGFYGLQDNKLKAIRKLYGVFDNGMCQSRENIAVDFGVTGTTISKYVADATIQFEKYVKNYANIYLQMEDLRELKQKLKGKDLTKISLKDLNLDALSQEYLEELNVKNLDDFFNIDDNNLISICQKFNIIVPICIAIYKTFQVSIDIKIELLGFSNGVIEELKKRGICFISQFSNFSLNIADYLHLGVSYENVKKTIEKAKLLGFQAKIFNKEESLLFCPIEELDLSVRAFNCLKRADIYNVGDIIKLSEEQINNIRNLGKKPYCEIIDKIHSWGLLMSWETPVVEKENESLQENNIEVDKIANNNVEEKNETPIEKYKRLLNEKAMLQQKLLELDTELAELLFSVRDNGMERVDNNGTTRR